ncbi:uncharacterized protein [Apostichopus japonicus]|uniref:uncharacterized protein n=1 Tax=Stichopus japonicus TaxID=307972 RepID=UPI003AB55B96
MDDDEITAEVIDHISIPISALGEDLNCPICCNLMCPAMITYCGHRFCEKCIQTSVSQWKKCPVCNKRLNQDQLIQDKGFNNLVQVIETQKKEAAATYFNQAAANAERELVQGGSVIIPNAAIKPVLQKHLKKTLLEFELFSQKLQRDLSEQVMSSLTLAGGEAMPSPSDTMQTCLSSVVDAYDRYLSENLPPLTLLPVTVEVKIHGKDHMILPSFSFKPSTSIERLYESIFKYLASGKDPLIDFERNSLSFILVRPSAVGQVCLTADLVNSIYLQQLTEQYVMSTAPLVVMSENSYPLLTYQLTSGSEVIVFGNMKFQSELPKSCFIQLFRKDVGMVMDYFACSDCALTWICRPCKESCHDGHSVKSHVMKHTPAWACCYCKKKQCCLVK